MPLRSERHRDLKPFLRIGKSVPPSRTINPGKPVSETTRGGPQGGLRTAFRPSIPDSIIEKPEKRSTMSTKTACKRF